MDIMKLVRYSKIRVINRKTREEHTFDTNQFKESLTWFLTKKEKMIVIAVYTDARVSRVAAYPARHYGVLGIF